MLIRLFKPNNPAVALVFLPLAALLLWLPALLHPPLINLTNTMPLYELLVYPLTGHEVLALIIALIIVLAEAFLLNNMINEHEILERQTYLPALIYVVLMSCSRSLLTLHPLLFANLFILLSLDKLISTYRKDAAFAKVFEAGLLFSLASLFYFPVLFLFPSICAALLIFRPFIWREWVITCIGILLPYLFILVFYFWHDKVDYFWYEKILVPFFDRADEITRSRSFFFLIGSIGSVLFLAFMRLGRNLGTTKLKVRSSLMLFVWFMLFSVASVFITSSFSMRHFSFAIIPAAIFIANYFLTFKKIAGAEVLFLILIVFIFIHHFNLII